ncbi:hypothetical protein FOZ63_030492 [Perkinsus olseni]|uniref:Uncharacterized protein n=1 Tax=Perkinsus olseni TaxID=32597 RepID=A0A7J6RFT4_PEROL|nr:hypothetical protein FOZ63_030492 [Perkinsus olseni]KAF4755660.1 hypothetical protein FOZ62_031895 [Perkinsus olseni]
MSADPTTTSSTTEASTGSSSAAARKLPPPSRPKKSENPSVLESLGIVVAKGSKKRVKLAASESRRVRARTKERTAEEESRIAVLREERVRQRAEKEHPMNSLFAACRSNDSLTIADLIGHKEVGANVKYPHPIDGLGVGAAAIHVAAQYGATGAVTTLLDAGADKEQVTEQGQTALHVAAKRGLPATCQLLIAKGANLGVKDRFGCTPLDLAKREEHRSNFHAEVVKLLKRTVRKILMHRLSIHLRSAVKPKRPSNVGKEASGRGSALSSITNVEVARQMRAARDKAEMKALPREAKQEALADLRALYQESLTATRRPHYRSYEFSELALTAARAPSVGGAAEEVLRMVLEEVIDRREPVNCRGKLGRSTYDLITRAANDHTSARAGGDFSENVPLNQGWTMVSLKNLTAGFCSPRGLRIMAEKSLGGKLIAEYVGDRVVLASEAAVELSSGLSGRGAVQMLTGLCNYTIHYPKLDAEGYEAVSVGLWTRLLGVASRHSVTDLALSDFSILYRKIAEVLPHLDQGSRHDVARASEWLLMYAEVVPE